ncbi:MAG: hypothetical protein SCJ94_01675 [Bacillota bacterium]|nr:hypothetical protein [Bacillota bacterium]
MPLISEFLENDGELEAIESDEEWKQVCELKAFYRLSKRQKIPAFVVAGRRRVDAPGQRENKLFEAELAKSQAGFFMGK